MISEQSRNAFQKQIANYRNFAKTARTNPWNTRSLTNLDDISLACIELYKSPTIFRGAKKTQSQRKITPNINQVLISLAKKIHSYLNNNNAKADNQTDFDKLHENLCDSFMENLNAERVKVNYDNISYGQAQKMINILFKYLACYSDYPMYADLFKYCHLPIDNKILALIKDNCNIENIEYRKSKNQIVGAVYKKKHWQEFDKKTYLDIVSEYRKCAENKGFLKGHSFLEFEFNEWN